MKKLWPTALLLMALSLAVSRVAAQSKVWKEAREQKEASKNKLHEKREKLITSKNRLLSWGVSDTFSRSFSIGGAYHSNGYGFSLLYGKKDKKENYNQFSLGFSEVFHEKETKIRQTNDSFYSSVGRLSPFKFGKLYNNYQISLGYHREKILFPALLNGETSFGIRYGAGILLAIYKPYNLYLIRYDSSGKPIKNLEQYDEGNKEIFLNRGRILGAAEWSKGFNTLSFRPGASAQVAFFIEPGKPKSFVKKILVGGDWNYALNPKPILADHTARAFQPYYFMGLEIGKRW